MASSVTGKFSSLIRAAGSENGKVAPRVHDDRSCLVDRAFLCRYAPVRRTGTFF